MLKVQSNRIVRVEIVKKKRKNADVRLGVVVAVGLSLGAPQKGRDNCKAEAAGLGLE